MSKYTTELRYICESEAGLKKSTGYNDVKYVIANSRDKIFSFDYPCWAEWYKEGLETKILKHFYTREIAYESYGLWKLKLDMKMNEIMPYYNKLYESEMIKFNPMWDVDYRNEGTVDTNGTVDKSGITIGNTQTNYDESKTTDSTTGTTIDTDTTDHAEYDEATTTDSTTDEKGTSTKDSTNTRTEDVNKAGNIVTNTTEDIDHSGSDSTTGHSHGWTLHSDTPQGGLQNFIPDKVAAGKDEDDETIDKYIYLTDAVETIGDNTGSGTNSYDESRSGSTTTNETNTEDNTITDVYTEKGTTTDNTVYDEDGTKKYTLDEKGTVDTTKNVIYDEDGTKQYTQNTDNTQNTNQNTTSSNLEASENRLYGKRSAKSYSEMLQLYRDTFINVDMMVIEELEPLFMQIW